MTRTAEGGVVACHAHALRADLTSVDAIARLSLAAKRSGARLRLVDASLELLELLNLCGVEPFGQAEEREQALRVEERREGGPAAL